jgi:hypothetical protein
MDFQTNNYFDWKNWVAKMPRVARIPWGAGAYSKEPETLKTA